MHPDMVVLGQSPAACEAVAMSGESSRTTTGCALKMSGRHRGKMWWSPEQQLRRCADLSLQRFV